MPGQEIEAVHAWQHRARTPIAQRRSQWERSGPRSWHVRPAVDATGWDRRLADDVTAPSALTDTDAGAERLPDCY